MARGCKRHAYSRKRERDQAVTENHLSDNLTMRRLPSSSYSQSFSTGIVLHTRCFHCTELKPAGHSKIHYHRRCCQCPWPCPDSCWRCPELESRVASVWSWESLCLQLRSRESRRRGEEPARRAEARRRSVVWLLVKPPAVHEHNRPRCASPPHTWSLQGGDMVVSYTERR